MPPHPVAVKMNESTDHCALNHRTRCRGLRCVAIPPGTIPQEPASVVRHSRVGRPLPTSRCDATFSGIPKAPAMLHVAMNSKPQLGKGFRPMLRLLSGALLVAFAFTLLAAPSLLAPRGCSMPCCKTTKSARIGATAAGQCRTQCGMTRNTAPAPLPRTVQTTVSTSTHPVTTVVAVISARPQIAPPQTQCSIPAHPSDAPLHVLNSVFLI